MARQLIPMPTDAELAILKVLWAKGPSTVRQVHQTFESSRSTGYTTTLKQLQVMTDKGLVTRDERERTHIYHASHDETKVLRRIAGDLLQRAFDGSARKLVMHALSTKRATPEELARIRTLLDKWEGGKTDEHA